MEISEMVPALLGGMSIAAVVLLGVRLMLGPNEKRRRREEQPRLDEQAEHPRTVRRW